MRVFSRGLLVTLALAATACPYESEQPLLPADEARIDARLTGIWECGEGTEAARWDIAAFDDHAYVVVGTKAGDDEVLLLRAHAGRIGTGDFLTFTELNQKRSTGKLARKPSGWMLARYDLPGSDRLSLRLLDGDAVAEGTTSQDLLARLAKDPDARTLYGDDKPANCKRLESR